MPPGSSKLPAACGVDAAGRSSQLGRFWRFAPSPGIETGTWVRPLVVAQGQLGFGADGICCRAGRVDVHAACTPAMAGCKCALGHPYSISWCVSCSLTCSWASSSSCATSRAMQGMHACPCVASHCNADPNDSGVVAAVVAVGLGFRVKLSQLSQTMFRGRLS
jgi:hypothetical protein